MRQVTRREFLRTGLALGAAALVPAPALGVAARTLQTPERALDVRAFGARGDGRADDTAAVQAAIDAAVRAGGGVVRFPAGTYLVNSVDIHPGLTYLGEPGSVVKRPDDLAGTRLRRGTRTFTTQRVRYAGVADSPPLVLRGLTFDGNVNRQTGKEATDQAHLLFLWADERQPGRLRVVIEDCRFQDSPADAITVYKNVDAVIRNCVAYNCRRGGLIINGGYSTVAVSNFRATAGTYRPRISMEIAGRGFGGTEATDVVLDQVHCEGTFEMEINGGSVTGTNLTLVGPAFNIYGHGRGRARFSNCLIHVGPLQGNRLQSPGTVTFEQCRFVAWRAPGEFKKTTPVLRALNINWESHLGRRDQTVRAVHCEFVADRPTIPAGMPVVAVSTGADAPGSRNRLMVEGGRISGEYDLGFLMDRGGTWLVRGTTIDARKAFELKAPRGFPFDVTIDGVLARGRVLALRLSGDNNRFEYP